jgi:hypothetical protein
MKENSVFQALPNEPDAEYKLKLFDVINMIATFDVEMMEEFTKDLKLIIAGEMPIVENDQVLNRNSIKKGAGSGPIPMSKYITKGLF